MLDNIEDLETAAILTLLGHLDSVKFLYLQDINLSCAPSNIVNSLFEDVIDELNLERVCGFSLSMLVNKKFDLTLMKLKIPTQEAQDIHFKGEVFISDVDGDLSD